MTVDSIFQGSSNCIIMLQYQDHSWLQLNTLDTVFMYILFHSFPPAEQIESIGCDTSSSHKSVHMHFPFSLHPLKVALWQCCQGDKQNNCSWEIHEQETSFGNEEVVVQDTFDSTVHSVVVVYHFVTFFGCTCHGSEVFIHKGLQ
jgi:hypothetical protein